MPSRGGKKAKQRKLAKAQREAAATTEAAVAAEAASDESKHAQLSGSESSLSDAMSDIDDGNVLDVKYQETFFDYGVPKELLEALPTRQVLYSATVGAPPTTPTSGTASSNQGLHKDQNKSLLRPDYVHPALRGTGFTPNLESESGPSIAPKGSSFNFNVPTNVPAVAPSSFAALKSPFSFNAPSSTQVSGLSSLAVPNPSFSFNAPSSTQVSGLSSLAAPNPPFSFNASTNVPALEPKTKERSRPAEAAEGSGNQRSHEWWADIIGNEEHPGFDTSLPRDIAERADRAMGMTELQSLQEENERLIRYNSMERFKCMQEKALLRDEVATLREGQDQITALKEQVQNQEQQIIQLKSEYHTTEAQSLMAENERLISEHSEELLQCQEEKAALEFEVSALKGAHEQVTVLQGQVRDTTAKYNRLVRKTMAHELKDEKSLSFGDMIKQGDRSEINRLKGELKDLNERYKSEVRLLKDSARELRAENVRMKETGSNPGSNPGSTLQIGEQQYRDLLSERDHYQQELEQIRQQVMPAEIEIKRLQGALQAMESKFNDSSESQTNQENVLRAKEQEIEQVKDTARFVEAQAQKAEEEYRRLSEHLEAAAQKGLVKQSAPKCQDESAVLLLKKDLLNKDKELRNCNIEIKDLRMTLLILGAKARGREQPPPLEDFRMIDIGESTQDQRRPLLLTNGETPQEEPMPSCSMDVELRQETPEGSDMMDVDLPPEKSTNGDSMDQDMDLTETCNTETTLPRQMEVDSHEVSMNGKPKIKEDLGPTMSKRKVNLTPTPTNMEFSGEISQKDAKKPKDDFTQSASSVQAPERNSTIDFTLDNARPSSQTSMEATGEEQDKVRDKGQSKPPIMNGSEETPMDSSDLAQGGPSETKRIILRLPKQAPEISVEAAAEEQEMVLENEQSKPPSISAFENTPMGGSDSAQDAKLNKKRLKKQVNLLEAVLAKTEQELRDKKGELSLNLKKLQETEGDLRAEQGYKDDWIKYANDMSNMYLSEKTHREQLVAKATELFKQKEDELSEKTKETDLVGVENARLLSIIKGRDNENQRLKEKSSLMMGKIEVLEKDNEEKITNIKSTQEENINLKKQNRFCEQDNEKKASDLESIRKENISLKEQIQSLEKARTELAVKSQSLAKKLARAKPLEREVVSLTEELKSSKETIARQKVEHEFTSSAYANSRKEKKKLQTEYESCKNKNNAISDDLALSEQKLAKAREEIADLQNRLECNHIDTASSLPTQVSHIENERSARAAPALAEMNRVVAQKDPREVAWTLRQADPILTEEWTPEVARREIMKYRETALKGKKVADPEEYAQIPLEAGGSLPVDSSYIRSAGEEPGDEHQHDNSIESDVESSITQAKSRSGSDVSMSSVKTIRPQTLNGKELQGIERIVETVQYQSSGTQTPSPANDDSCLLDQHDGHPHSNIVGVPVTPASIINANGTSPDSQNSDGAVENMERGRPNIVEPAQNIDIPRIVVLKEIVKETVVEVTSYCLYETWLRPYKDLFLILSLVSFASFPSFGSLLYRLGTSLEASWNWFLGFFYMQTNFFPPSARPIPPPERRDDDVENSGNDNENEQWIPRFATDPDGRLGMYYLEPPWAPGMAQVYKANPSLLYQPFLPSPPMPAGWRVDAFLSDIQGPSSEVAPIADPNPAAEIAAPEAAVRRRPSIKKVLLQLACHLVFYLGIALWACDWYRARAERNLWLSANDLTRLAVVRGRAQCQGTDFWAALWGKAPRFAKELRFSLNETFGVDHRMLG